MASSSEERTAVVPGDMGNVGQAAAFQQISEATRAEGPVAHRRSSNEGREDVPAAVSHTAVEVEMIVVPAAGSVDAGHRSIAESHADGATAGPAAVPAVAAAALPPPEPHDSGRILLAGNVPDQPTVASLPQTFSAVPVMGIPLGMAPPPGIIIGSPAFGTPASGGWYPERNGAPPPGGGGSGTMMATTDDGGVLFVTTGEDGQRHVTLVDSEGRALHMLAYPTAGGESVGQQFSTAIPSSRRRVTFNDGTAPGFAAEFGAGAAQRRSGSVGATLTPDEHMPLVWRLGRTVRLYSIADFIIVLLLLLSWTVFAVLLPLPLLGFTGAKRFNVCLTGTYLCYFPLVIAARCYATYLSVQASDSSTTTMALFITLGVLAIALDLFVMRIVFVFWRNLRSLAADQLDQLRNCWAPSTQVGWAWW